MDVHVDRDAVGPGDDDASHAKRLVVPDDLTVEEVIERVVSSGYLPTVAGGRATWSVTSGVPLAVVAVEWDAPARVSWRPVDPGRLVRRDGVLGLRFNYHAMVDPRVVLETLRRLRLDPFSDR